MSVWILECSGCREHWSMEVDAETLFPLRCTICALLEGWSQDFNRAFALRVSEELVKHFGPGPIEVGPWDEGDYFRLYIQSPLRGDAAVTADDQFIDWFVDQSESSHYFAGRS